MRKAKWIAFLLVCMLMLSGCGISEGISGLWQMLQPNASETTAEATSQPQIAAPSHGMFIHIERTEREAYDPAEGTQRILTYAWDSVRVESNANPQAAARITEELAALQDIWYTGSGSTEGDDYGYSAMLAAAEDNYAIAREYQISMECAATRYVTVLRADDEVCVFLINNYVDLGGAHGSYSNEAVCFDARTGQRLQLEDLTGDMPGLCARLISEMLRLAAEDRDGYYTEHLALTAPEQYESAFAALLRDAAWYPGQDCFHLFSDLYELGPYAAGITDFPIPYESLAGLLNARWLPTRAESQATVRLAQLQEIQEGSVEIADRIVIGDGGEAGLILFSGEARDVSIWSAFAGDRFYPDAEQFFCGRIKDSGLQIAVWFPGDLPNTMLRYTDQSGEHEYLVTHSGEDGRLILAENNFMLQG